MAAKQPISTWSIRALAPNDPVSHEAFAVIRDAMAANKVYGVLRLVMGRRERAIVLNLRDEGIVM